MFHIYRVYSYLFSNNYANNKNPSNLIERDSINKFDYVWNKRLELGIFIH